MPRGSSGRSGAARRVAGERDDLAGDHIGGPDEPVIAADDLDKPRTFDEPAGAFPAAPDAADVLVGHAFVPRSHHDDDRRGRRIAVAFQGCELFEESAVNQQLLPKSVMEERKRVSGRKLLDPPSSESDGRRHEKERSACAESARLERRKGAKGAAHDHRGNAALRLRQSDLHDCREIEVAERRDVQVRCDDPKGTRIEKRFQSRHLSPFRRRCESVQVEDVLHASRKDRLSRTRRSHMTRRITRRTAAKLVLSASAALALPNPIAGEPAGKASPKATLSANERKLLDKSVVQLRDAARKIQRMKIAIGAEPAFVFRARLPKK